MKQTHRIGGFIVAAALAAAACSGGGGGDDEESATTDEPAATDAPVDTDGETVTTDAPDDTDETTTTTEPEIVDDVPRQPLTGEVVDSVDDVQSRPALVVKIDNNDSAARPNHSGLAVADIVFEEIVETGTRFAAVFHTQDADPIGPIRSGREQDVDLLLSLNQPLFAWSGGNAGVTQFIRNSPLTDLNWQRNAGSYYRGPGGIPNNLYSSTDRLYELTPEDHPGAPGQQFAFVVDGVAFDGDEVVGFEVDLDGTRVGWEWDEEAAAFARDQNGTRHVDVVNGDIFATNVLVMVVDYNPSSIDARSPNAQTTGSGPLFVFSEGEVITGRWSRNLAFGVIVLTDNDGNNIPLTPGNTWIELADNSGGPGFTTQALPIDETGAPTVDTIDPATIPVVEADNPFTYPTAISIEFPES